MALQIQKDSHAKTSEGNNTNEQPPVVANNSPDSPTEFAE